MKAKEIWDTLGILSYWIDQQKMKWENRKGTYTKYAISEKMTGSDLDTGETKMYTVISVIMTDNEKLADEYKSDLDAWLKVKGLKHVD
jgi:hypothetical protein